MATGLKIIVVDDAAALAIAAADRVLARIGSDPGRIAICLTGGSSPTQLYEVLGKPPYQSRIPETHPHQYGIPATHPQQHQISATRHSLAGWPFSSPLRCSYSPAHRLVRSNSLPPPPRFS